MDLFAVTRVGSLALLIGVVACSKRAGPPPAVRSQAHVFAGGIAPAAGEMKNPYMGDRGSVAEGERTFTAMNCDGCHGGGAVGWVGPSLVDHRWRYGGSDGELFHSIFYGRPRGMPAYGGILSTEAIWKIVTYLKAQPLPADVPTERWR